MVKPSLKQILLCSKYKDINIDILLSTEPCLVQGWLKIKWPPQDLNTKKKRKSHLLLPSPKKTLNFSLVSR